MPQARAKSTGANSGGRAEPSLDRLVTLMLDAVFADRQRLAASGLLDASKAASAAAESLAKAERESAAEASEMVADWLQTTGENLATLSPQEALEAVKGFARRHPAMFAAGSVLAGAALMTWLETAENGESVETNDGEEG